MTWVSLPVIGVLLAGWYATPPVTGQAFLLGLAGTYNVVYPYRLGTAVCYAWRAESETGSTFTLRGPVGWNYDTPAVETVIERKKGAYQSYLIRTAEFGTGMYTLAGTIDGNQVTASFSASGSSVMDRPSVRITVEGREKISAAWTAPRGAVSFDVWLSNRQTRTVVAFTKTRGTAHAFEGQAFPSGPYSVSVIAVPIDLTQPPGGPPPRCNVAHTVEEFTVP